MNDANRIAANRKLWDTRVGLHVDSKFYDVPGFLAGKSSLCGIEVDEIGPVAGKSLLHLQCHFGQDTLSWARQGANVTGVDFSSTAIAAARSLADQAGLAAEFIESDVLDLPKSLDSRFDIVFTSFGTIGWLPDLNRWAAGIRRALKPGGFFYMIDLHKTYLILDPETGQVKYDYFGNQGPDEEITGKTYADGLTHEPLAEFWWNHTFEALFEALRNAGLNLSSFREYPFCVYKLADSMIETSPGHWVYESLGGRIPYMYSLRAEA
jgi:ubiquinone/menaquinone biosynthesis C-methylase UbiE